MKRRWKVLSWLWLPIASSIAAITLRRKHAQPEDSNEHGHQSHSRSGINSDLLKSHPMAMWLGGAAFVTISLLLMWWVLPQGLPGRILSRGNNAKSPQQSEQVPATGTPEEQLKAQLTKIFQARAQALMHRDTSGLSVFYNSNADGRKTLRHERDRVRYMASWLAHRRARLVESSASLVFDRVKLEGNTATVNLKQSAKLGFSSLRKGGQVHRFGIGTRHRLGLIQTKGQWIINTDEFSDPLAEEPLAPIIAYGAQTLPISPQTSTSVSPTTTSARPPSTPTVTKITPPPLTLPAVARSSSTYHRQSAVNYANRYCGAAPGCGNQQLYNESYGDLTALGGDCTNFVSQSLADPTGGGLTQTQEWAWRPEIGMGTPAWQQTVGFARYIVHSKVARLAAKGRLREVTRRSRHNPEGAIKRLQPGDLIGYEENGRILHFAIVTGKDSSGLPVVNSHTSDRYHVPWELGWNEKTIYWLFALNEQSGAS